jgi:hypothetical protein
MTVPVLEHVAKSARHTSFFLACGAPGATAAYALEGKMDEAKSALAEARRLNPSYTVKWDREHAEDIPTRREGLRKAGLPEE